MRSKSPSQRHFVPQSITHMAGIAAVIPSRRRLPLRLSGVFGPKHVVGLGPVVMSAILFGALVTGCDRGPSCEGIFKEVSSGPVPTAWTSQGLTLAADSVVCAGADDRDLVVVERTNDQPAIRADKLRDQLRATGWVAVSSEPSAAGSHSVTLERGAEALVMTVHPVLDPNDKPALAIHLGIVARPGVGRPGP